MLIEILVIEIQNPQGWVWKSIFILSKLHQLIISQNNDYKPLE